MAKKFEIRNSTAEFLIFTVADKEQGVEVLYKDESIWATQKVIATLFDVDRTVVTKHLKNIFDTCELDKEVVCAKIAHTTEHGAIDGKTQTKEVQYYNLDAIISVATVSIPFVLPNSANGVPMCCANLPSVVMS